MADPLNTLRLAIQAKILQENDEPALSLKIFDPQCASRLAAWNVQANPAADIRGYKPPAQTAPTDLDQLIDRKVAEKMGEFMSRYSLAFSHIWTESVITERELGAPKRFKKALIVDRNAKSATRKGYLKCQMTGEEHYKGDVNAAHILPERAVAFLPVFGLKTDDINSVRNGLLLCRGIERAFDQQQICFIDAGPQGLILMVLDNNIRDDEAEPSRKKFSELEFETLSTPGTPPYRRILSIHAQISIFNAIKDNRITREQAQVFEQYHMDSPSRDDDEYDWSNKLSQLVSLHQIDI